MKITEGYWRVPERIDGGSGVYYVIEQPDGLKIEYLSEGPAGARSGVFTTSLANTWVAPVERITEKEYFLARLRGRP